MSGLFKSLFSWNKKEIDHAFTHAKKVHSVSGLKLLSSKNLFTENNSEHGKLLIIVPRKVGKAHIRNKIRRRIKEIFYTNQLYKKPLRSIILVYPDAVNLSFEQLTAFFTKGLS